MNHAGTVIVDLSTIEQFRYFLSHQPPFLGLILAYATVCLLMFWITRGRGYLISFLSAGLYLVPYWVH